MALEQMLELAPQMQKTASRTIDLYAATTLALYSGQLNSVSIYDFPGSGGQVHIHHNDLGTSGGRLYDYSRENWKPLNAYESAMFDLQANQLNIKPIRTVDIKSDYLGKY